MRHAAATRLFPLAACLFTLSASAPAADTTEVEQYEDKALLRATERATERIVRGSKADRAAWLKELTDAYGTKAGNPLKEDEYAAWFHLLAGDGATEWKRADAPSKALQELFDKVLQRLELGPVPSVKKDEFARYARRHLVPGNPGTPNSPEANEEPDRVFRVIDRDADGVLSADELTAKLKEDRKTADVDGNGRIDKDEYRAFFHRRAATAAEAAVVAKGGDPKAGGKAPVPAEFTAWLTDADSDKDGQISLSEWRRAAKAIAEFRLMDLDGDGLLTKEEYQRYVRLKEKEPDPDPPA